MPKIKTLAAVVSLFVGFQTNTSVAGGAPALIPLAAEPREIQGVLTRLDEIEKSLAAHAMAPCTAKLLYLGGPMLGPPSVSREWAVVQSSPRYSEMLRRFRAAELRYIKMGGGHAPELYGDGSRAARVSLAGQEAASQALTACRVAEDFANYGFADDAEKLKAAYADYERKIARALQIDRDAFRGAQSVVYFALCERTVAQLRDSLPTRLRQARSGKGSYEICWYVERDLKLDQAKQRFLTASTNRTAERIELPCERAPTKTTVTGKLFEAIQGYRPRPNDVVVTVDELRERAEVSGKTAPIVTVRVYSRNGDPSPGHSPGRSK